MLQTVIGSGIGFVAGSGLGYWLAAWGRRRKLALGQDPAQ